MGTDFVLQVKFIIFWPNRGSMVYLYAPDFQKKVPPSTFYIFVLLSQEHPILEAFLVLIKSNHEKPVLANIK